MTALEKNTSEKKMSPMLVQYLEYKDKYPDALLFFQVGDFYETFFDDAITSADVLNITLTSRDKNSPEPIPMAGMPQAVIDTYIDRLVAQGHSVAIVSQAGPVHPGKMVKRKLDRIITPGIRILGSNDSGETSVTAVVFIDSPENCAIAFSDVQSGLISVREGCELNNLFSELSKISPTELILPNRIDTKTVDRRTAWVRELARLIDPKALKFRHPSRELENFSPKRFEDLSGYMTLSPCGRKAVALLVEYIDETTVDARIKLNQVSTESYKGLVSIDARTRDNLDLIKNSRHGGKSGSLFGYLDETSSPLGRRLLRSRILTPANDLTEIKRRLDAVQEFLSSSSERKVLRDTLRHVPDLERIATRIELNVASPAELGSLRDGLLALISNQKIIIELIQLVNSPLEALARELTAPKELIEILNRALVENPPHALKAGEIFRKGYNQELDKYRLTKTEGKNWISELEAREKKATGITSLKVKSNNVIGYYIDVTKANLAKVPASYIRKGQTTNSERFITEELKQLESDVSGAEFKQIELEQNLFKELREELKVYSANLRKLAKAVAEVDVFQTLAEIAERDNLVRPKIEASRSLIIKSGKHPILAKTLEHEFIPNDLELHEHGPRALIVTGPNMGGKSTYLRQAALISIMAQLGSFVPVQSATLGLVDKVFARLGASDDLTEGESTFMVEMRETSYILSNATEKSLILIDEIGRGTATRDGFVIARSVLEWVMEKIQCRMLFATHFHELTELEAAYAELKNVSVRSLEKANQVVFTHEMCAGAANNSYGIEVADLAGLPKQLVARSRKILKSIISNIKAGDKNQLEMFKSDSSVFETDSEIVELSPKLAEIETELKEIEPNSITPIEALAIIDRLHRKVKS
ncbi:MAG: DNA mismatch repair protein MutS [Bdellovibrionota bacterium]